MALEINGVRQVSNHYGNRGSTGLSLSRDSSFYDNQLYNNSFVLFGDSITSNCHMTVVTPSKITRSGNTVTVTASTHLMQVGKKVKVANVLPDDFNGIVTVSAVTSTSWSYELPGTQGGAIISGSTHPSGGFVDIKDLTNLSCNGMWLMVNGLMGGSLELVANCARGGWRASYALEHIEELEAEIAATERLANNAYIAMGINDIVGDGDSVDNVITSLKGLVNWNRTKGRRVFLDTLKPLGVLHPSYNADNKARIAEINRWILNKSAKELGSIPIDTYTPLLDPLTGASKTGYLGGETIHPNVSAIIDVIAPTIKATFQNHLDLITILPASIGDTYGASSISNNLNDIGPWATTGGGTISGNVLPGAAGVCAGFKITESGAAAASNVQINTNTDGYPEQQFDLSGTVANNDNVDLTYNFDITRLSAGDKVRLVFHVDLSNLDSTNGNIKAFSAYVVAAAGGFNGYYQVGEYNGANAPWTGVSSTSQSFDYVSEEWEVPTNLTAFNLHIKLTGAGAVAGNAATVKISRLGLIKS